MSRKWLEIIEKLSCLIPGTFNAIWYNIREHSQTAYVSRRFSGVEFRPLAYASGDCKFEAPCRICEGSRLNKVTMGRHTYCGAQCYLNHCTIGRFCSIGNQVIIGPWLHPTDLVSTFPGFYHSYRYTTNLRCNEEIKTFSEVRVGNDVWIGDRSIVLGGITIGDGAVIGAGAVVTKSVPPYAVQAGVPARTIRMRFEPSVVDRLLEIRWWDYDDETLLKYSRLFGDLSAFLEGFGK